MAGPTPIKDSYTSLLVPLPRHNLEPLRPPPQQGPRHLSSRDFAHFPPADQSSHSHARDSPRGRGWFHHWAIRLLNFIPDACYRPGSHSSRFASARLAPHHQIAFFRPQRVPPLQTVSCAFSRNQGRRRHRREHSRIPPGAASWSRYEAHHVRRSASRPGLRRRHQSRQQLRHRVTV
jgi:hypothetical protein